MSMISWPFDSTVTFDTENNPIYDRTYSADVLARILRKYFKDGVFSTQEDCLRVVEATGMNVTVNPGDCMIQGRHGYLETPQTLAIGTADPALKRIDLVVLRLDLSVNELSIKPAVVVGSEAVNPVAPALTRNSTVYELALAEVYVGANVTAISQAAITDARLDSTRCGVVASIIGDTDTSTYYAQIAADLAEFKAGQESDFDAWFATITSILDQNTAANLLNMINTLNAEMDDVQTLGTQTQNSINALNAEMDNVLHTSAQSLTTTQQTQARSNVNAQSAITASGMLKGNGAGSVSAAAEGVDYVGIAGGKAKPERTSANLIYGTVSKTLEPGHAGCVLRLNSSSNLTVTIPTDATVLMPNETEIEVVRWGTGNVTFVPASGVSIRSVDNQRSIAEQYASACLKKISANIWLLTGYLA